MATLLWQRDIASDAEGVKTTFSSWDACMSKTYCKYPAIIGIVIGCLIVVSVIWCAARCLCCGAECCCGCLACCNACCPSPRGRRSNNNAGYQQAPPAPQYPPYSQYASPAAPSYAGGGYRGAQTATFDAPTKHGGLAIAKVDEDRLPAMPSWQQAASRRVEDTRTPEEGEVELEKLDHHNPYEAQQQTLLPNDDHADQTGRYYGQSQPQLPQLSHQDQAYGGASGNMHASPYHQGYDQAQSPQPYATRSPATSAYGGGATAAYPRASQYTSPTSTAYEPSVYPPSYHTSPPSVAGGSSQPYQSNAYGQPPIGRKPVQGSWRDV